MTRLRQFLRWSHMIAGIYVGTYLLSPLYGNTTATLAAQIVVIAVGASGLIMWQWPRVAKRLYARQGAR